MLKVQLVPTFHDGWFFFASTNITIYNTIISPVLLQIERDKKLERQCVYVCEMERHVKRKC